MPSPGGGTKPVPVGPVRPSPPKPTPPPAPAPTLQQWAAAVTTGATSKTQPGIPGATPQAGGQIYSGGGGGGGSAGTMQQFQEAVSSGATATSQPGIPTTKAGLSTSASLSQQQQLDKAGKTLNTITDTYGKSNLYSPLVQTNRYQDLGSTSVRNATTTIGNKIATVTSAVADFSTKSYQGIQMMLNKPKVDAKKEVDKQVAITNDAINRANTKVEEYNQLQNDFSKKWDSKITTIKDEQGNDVKAFTGTPEEYTQYQKDYSKLDDKYVTAQFNSQIANSSLNTLNSKTRQYTLKYEPSINQAGGPGTSLKNYYRNMGVTALATAATLPASAIALAGSLLSRPVKTVQEQITSLKQFPTLYKTNPSEATGQLIGTLVGGYVTGQALGSITGKTTTITKVTKTNPEISISRTVQDAIKIGENENGIAKWKVNSIIQVNKINPKTGDIVKVIRVDAVSDVITSQTPEGIIKSLAKSDATAIRSSRIYQSKTGLLDTNKIVVSADVYKSLTKGTLSPVAEKVYSGTATSKILQAGTAKASLTYDQLVNKGQVWRSGNELNLKIIKTQIPKQYTEM